MVLSPEKTIAKFRLSSHSLNIETGRWHKPKPIERELRFCPWCPTKIEDEFHFILECPKYEQLRRTHLPSNALHFRTKNSFYNLINSQSVNTLKKLAIFINLR